MTTTGKPKVATPITDKNGKNTTVHKNVDDAAALSKRIKGIGGVPKPVQPKREPLINTALIHADYVEHEDEDNDDDDYFDEEEFQPAVPGNHPKYGGMNWGVNYTNAWGDWQVNHGYYGGSRTDFSGNVFVDGSSVPLDSGTVRWTADTKTGEEAAILWQYRDDINAALVTKGYGPHSSVRIRADITDDVITLREYDHRSWEGLVVNRD